MGADLVLPQLPLGPLPGFRIDNRWHRDGNPLARGPSGPALRIARDTVCATTGAIGLADLRWLSAVVIGFALIDLLYLSA